MKSPQINLDTVKEILKKLSFLKNNLALLVPIIIALVAGLLFIPTKLLSARLRRTINQQSIASATEIDKLSKSIKQAGQPEAIDEYLNAYEQDPCQMETLMKQTTQRELFSYKIFPDSNETSPVLFDPIQRKYLAGIDAMVQRVQGGMPPGESEIVTALKQAPRRSMYGMGMGGGYGGLSSNTSVINYRSLPAMERRIVDKLCEDKARGIRVYLSPADIDGYSFWSEWKFEDRDSAVRQAWCWQMGYWIVEDVVDTVRKMNENSASVLDAPVKRVLDTSFVVSSQGTRKIGGRRNRRAGDSKQMPTYVINFQTAIAAPPCTGRFCNADIDVIHFSVRMIVGADQVMPVVRELCSAKKHKFFGWHGEQPEQTFEHNQISVLETNIMPVDLEGPEHSVYRYGDDPVVDLELICEYVFQRRGYDQVKPKLIQDDIAGTEEM